MVAIGLSYGCKSGFITPTFPDLALSLALALALTLTLTLTLTLALALALALALTAALTSATNMRTLRLYSSRRYVMQEGLLGNLPSAENVHLREDLSPHARTYYLARLKNLKFLAKNYQDFRCGST